MPDDTFRQERRKINPEQPVTNNPKPEDIHAFQRQMGLNIADNPEIPIPAAQQTPFFEQQSFAMPQIKGNVPPQFQQMLKERLQQTADDDTPQHRPQPTPSFAAPIHNISTNDPSLTALLSSLSTQNYDEVTLPSLGRFYSGADEPVGGKLHIRPMTGQEESILATTRYMRHGQGIDMIFRNCTKEQGINPDKLLAADRVYLLIYLRAISYGNIYEVNMKCDSCGNNIDHQIDLNLPVNYCPDDFNENNFIQVLPSSGYSFKYRLARGSDETQVFNYRERKKKIGGGDAINDTFFFRASLLIDWIGNDKARVDQKFAIQQLIQRLPAMDTNMIRNTLDKDVFGVETEVLVVCPHCGDEFKAELPYDANFFSPRVKVSS